MGMTRSLLVWVNQVRKAKGKKRGFDARTSTTSDSMGTCAGKGSKKFKTIGDRKKLKKK